MKIFNRDLNEFKEQPEIIEDHSIDFGDLSFDTPDKEAWLSIPNSKNMIMEGYITRDGKEFRPESFTEIIRYLEHINKESAKQYRLPYVKEIYDTMEFYQNSFPDDGAMFYSSILKRQEWLGEIIEYFPDREAYALYQYPSDMELIGDEIKFKEDVSKWIDAFTNSGYYNRRCENEFGYPVNIFKKQSVATDMHCNIFEVAAVCQHRVPVFRRYNLNAAVYEIYSVGTRHTGSQWNFRLVEVNE